MHSSNQLKIWTIITHFFILVGAGHGIATIGIIEIIGLSDFEQAAFNTSLSSPFKETWHAVGISSLLGQIVLIGSIFVANSLYKKMLHITGLLLLWLSIYYFVRNMDSESSVHFSLLFCIPFIICTLLPFIILPVRRWYNSLKQ